MIDLSHLPLLVSSKQLRELGLSATGAAHLKRACGVTKVGRFYYVERDRLAAELARREVKAS